MVTKDETARAAALQQVADDMAETLRSGVEGLQTMARTMQEAVGNSLEAVSELTRRSASQATQGFKFADDDALVLADAASQNLRAVAQSSTALAHAFQDVSREWFRMSQRRLQRNLDGLNALARCRSQTDLVAAQSSLVLGNLEQTLESSRRLAELVIQIADELSGAGAVAAEETTVEVERTAQRSSRAA